MLSEMKMEMRASEDIEMGQDITIPLAPLAFSLYDSFLSSHCSSCLSPLSPHQPPFPPLLSSSLSNPSSPLTVTTLLYCSPSCSLSDSPLHLSSAEFQLLKSLPATCLPLSSDIRAALRLLHFLPATCPPSAHLHRIAGLLTNRHRLMSKDSAISAQIREGAMAMAAARRRARGGGDASDQKDFFLEEAVLCLVITNAVEVQDKTGRPLGIAVYDASFSWINHSCSPNACYRFVLSSPNTAFPDDSRRLRIVPHITESYNAEGESGVYSNIEFHQGRNKGNGPRMIVRSIKWITKGEEVTVSYTDLLQPKAVRQSELWSKYQFICCCRRCSASPPTYVDCALEGLYFSKLDFRSASSDDNFHRDEATRKLTDYVDEAISEYLSVGEPESCCEKIECVLSQGLLGEHSGTNEEKSKLNFRLHPLHHLALNAYMTLASAYKIRSSNFEIDGDQLEGFDMNRTSAAYSLLLASATYHLFCSESSLIASAANFWTSAGECLLTLARSSAWGLPSPLSSLAKQKCTECSLMDIFEANLSFRQAENADFEDISSEFLACVTNMTQEVWSFLIHGCRYLQLFKDPIDFSWLGKSFNKWDFPAHLGSSNEDSTSGTEESISRREPQGCTNEGRVNVFQLGVHCLLFGGFLANICYGQNSHLTNNIRDILCDDENFVH